MLTLFPIHPRLVHFPIALGLVGVACIGWGLLRPDHRWIAYGRTSLLLAWLGALIAALSGLIDQSQAPDNPAVSAMMNLHITAGIGLIVVFGLALYWPLRDRKLFSGSPNRWAYLALLAAGAVLILVEGYIGGQLVYHLHVGVQ